MTRRQWSTLRPDAAVQLQRTARDALTRRKTAVKEEDEVDDEANNEGEEERPRVSAVI